MAINPRFITYFRETFFEGKEEEFQSFLTSLERSIPRTIRIRPGKEVEVKNRLREYGFVLTDTYIQNVFELGRSDDFDPLERRIGYTLDHLVGNFYIQELAAATAVEVLVNPKFSQTRRDLDTEGVPEGGVSKNTTTEETEGQMQRSNVSENFLILDMAASPGGKTTQLSEQYPDSFIVANEPTRERIPQLLSNLDRMGSANIGVTLYPGQYFRHTPEVFDRILLDAPCSGEGTLYKGTDATKHWHLKNIKNIAALQTKLLDAAIIALKVGGEMVYSTCSMNLLENEGVLDTIMKKYPDTFTITYQKRFWPHIDGTGGFFVAKITKHASIPTRESSRPKAINDEIHLCGKMSLDDRKNLDIQFYSHTGKLLAVRRHPELETLRDRYYFMRWGEKIGDIISSQIHLSAFALRYITTDDLPRFEITDESMLDSYLRGQRIETDHEDGPVLLTYHGIDIAIEEVIDSSISNQFPKDWQRK